jgi:protein-disulfide isomerase
MSGFWPRFAGLLGVTGLVVIFLFMSLQTADRIEFTDTQKQTSPTITIADPQRGLATAPVTLVIFSDYQCGACKELASVLGTLSNRFPNELRLVFKDMPNTDRHPEAMKAAIAAQCAGRQGQYWSYHDNLMTTEEVLSEGLYVQIARNLNLKEGVFLRCLQNEETRALVERGFDEGIRLGITATPTVFFGDSRQTGALTEAEIVRWTSLLND